MTTPDQPRSRRSAFGHVAEWCVWGAIFVGLMVAERRRPLRRRVEAQLDRTGRNMAIGGLAAAASTLTAFPVLAPLERWLPRRRIGLLRRLRLPPLLETVAGILLLDYTLYVWHWLNHRAPFLWRFHLVHHVDLDLDASTGLRFHFGELALSTGFRAAQLVLLGVDRKALSIWHRALFFAVVFHHSNLRLPVALEQRLSYLVVTPRMHGIHHSMIRQETDSNFSSVLSCWDWIHWTMRLNVPQRAITIGVPAYREPRDVGLAKVLALPFMSERPCWQLPQGNCPQRALLASPRTQLAD